MTTKTRLSDIHKKIHRDTLELARRLRGHGEHAAHARMLELAKTSRFYFARLRALGD